MATARRGALRSGRRRTVQRMLRQRRVFGRLVGAALIVVLASTSAVVALGIQPAQAAKPNSQDDPPNYSNWPDNPANYPCAATLSYACAKGGYNATSAASPIWTSASG